MFSSPTRKFLLGAFVLALAAAGGFAVFAQEESATEASACDWHGPGSHISLDALAELDMTIAELRDHLMSGGTLQELLDESDLMADQQTRRLACIDELEANGDLTAEQAEALRAVIETGADQVMREAMGSRARGKGGHFGWSFRGGRGGHDFDARRFFGGRSFDGRSFSGRSFSGRGMPGIPDILRVLPFDGLDGLLEDLEESGSIDEAMRERLEQLEEALRSGSRGFFGFRIDRDDDGNWHFEWFDEDDSDTEAGSGSEGESEDTGASADNSA